MSWQREENAISRYAFSLDYAAAKWPFVSPKHRRGIAEALTDTTEALLAANKGAPSTKEVRAALRGWAYSERLHKGGEPPEHLVAVLRWLERNTVGMSELDPHRRAGSRACSARPVETA